MQDKVSGDFVDKTCTALTASALSCNISLVSLLTDYTGGDVLKVRVIAQSDKGDSAPSEVVEKTLQYLPRAPVLENDSDITD